MSRPGTTRVDMHVKILDERVVARAKARGVDVLVYAPHFTRLPEIEARAAHFSDDDLLVVPAREVFTGTWRDRKHVLAIGLSDPVPDFVTLDGAMAELARQDAAVLVPHPEFLSVGLSEGDVRHHREVVDAIEVYNPKHLPRDNRRAVAIAESLSMPAFASSYAHRLPTVGEAWTDLDRDVGDADDLVTALKGGAELTPGHRTGTVHDVRRAAEFAHLGWENSWKKVERVFLRGTEPTHPRHIAYDGAFDDVAVY